MKTTIPKRALNPSQLEFLQSKSPYLLFCAGVGSGKSAALILKALQLKGANGNLPGLLMAETFGELMSNLVDPMIEMLERCWPENRVPRIVCDNKGRRHLLFADGCKVHLRSAENIKGFTGLNVAWLCGDEPWLWSYRSYIKAIERVRIKSAPMLQRAFSSTPAMNFLSEEFNTGRKYRETIHCGTLENAGNLAPGYIEGLKEAYSPRMARAMLEGQWTIMEGAVFEEFDPNPKTSEWMIDFDPRRDLVDRKVYLAVDPGYRRSAWLWIAEINETEWVVYDQYMPENCPDENAIRAVNNKGWAVNEIWCDPAGGAKQSTSGTDTHAMLRKVNTRPGNRYPVRTLSGSTRGIEFGVDKLRVLLGGYEGFPRRLKFSKQLAESERGKNRGVIKDLASLRYPEMKDGRPVVDVPLKDGLTDHSTDALRYFGVSRWMVVPSLRRKDPVLSGSKEAGWKPV